MNTGHMCLQCGNCCRHRGYVRISAEETEEIASFLGHNTRNFVDEFTRLIVDRSGLSLNEKENGSCIFLTESFKCLLEAVKPAQCRTFPSKWNYPGWEKDCLAACRSVQISELIEEHLAPERNEK
jgi:Fe-S-cluster containining protein